MEEGGEGNSEHCGGLLQLHDEGSNAWERARAIK